MFIGEDREAELIAWERWEGSALDSLHPLSKGLTGRKEKKLQGFIVAVTSS